MTLPLSVQVGIPDVPAKGPFSTISTWTEISSYVIDAEIQIGKQHALDQMEASSLSLTLDNRGSESGSTLLSFNPWYFLNQTAVVPVQIPIRIQATWSAVTYNIFWGLIDSCVPTTPDELNSEVTLTATDLLKYLSNVYIVSNYYALQVEAIAGLIGYWRLGEAPGTRNLYDSSPQFNFTVASCTISSSAFTVSTTASFATPNAVFAGMAVTGTNIPANTFVVSVNSSTNITLSAKPTSSTTETLTFIKSPYTARAAGAGTLGGAGVILYDTDSALDCANATVTPQGYFLSGSGFSLAMNTNAVSGITDAQQNWTASVWVAANAPVLFGSPGAVLFGTFNSSGDYFQLIAYPGEPMFGGAYSNFQVITGDLDMTLTTGNTQCNVFDGNWHNVVLTGKPVSSNFVITLYVDGVSVGTGSMSSSLTGWWSPFAAGDQFTVAYDCNKPGPSWPGEIDEIAVWTTCLNSTQVEFLYDVGTWFYNADWSGDRIAQVLAVVGIPISVYGGSQAGVHGGTIAQGRVQVATAQDGVSVAGGTPVALTQQSALEYIQTVETTENGAFYQLGNGQIAYRDQYYYFTNSTSITSQVALVDNSPDGTYPYHYKPGINIIQDDQDIFNVIQVQPANGIQQQAFNQASITQFGYRIQQGLSGTLQNTQQAALDLASQLLLQYQYPLIRVENVTTASYINAGATMPYQLGLYLYDEFNVIRQGQTGIPSIDIYPLATGYTSANITTFPPSPDYSTEPGHFLIEHIVHKITPGTTAGFVWETTWVGSPYEIQGRVFFLHLDNIITGKLDTDTLGP